jgi:peroxiredoxin
LLLTAVIGTAGVLFFLRRRDRKESTKVAAKPLGLPIAAPAPNFELNAYTGGTISLKQLLAYGKPLLLIFTNPTCGPCVILFEEIKEWQHAHSEQLTIALISFGTIKENFVNVARNSLGQVLLQREREVAEKYGANVTPTAVVVNREGKIASPLAAGADEIRQLLATVLGGSFNSGHLHRH